MAGGTLPDTRTDDFDLLLTSAADAPRPWVSLGARDYNAGVERLGAAVLANPLAASIAAQVLRLAEKLTMADALAVESLAYSSLLGGGEFARWHATAKIDAGAPVPPAPVLIERTDNRITLTLNDPAARNAMTSIRTGAGGTGAPASIFAAACQRANSPPPSSEE